MNTLDIAVPLQLNTNLIFPILLTDLNFIKHLNDWKHI